MLTGGGVAILGDRVTLTCGCDAQIVVSLLVFMPRHSIVRIVGKSASCLNREHQAGRRVIVRWSDERDRRVFTDVLGQ